MACDGIVKADLSRGKRSKEKHAGVPRHRSRRNGDLGISEALCLGIWWQAHEACGLGVRYEDGGRTRLLSIVDLCSVVVSQLRRDQFFLPSCNR